MIVIKKKMKKSLLIAILAGVLAVLIAGAIIVNTIIAGRSGNTGDNPDSSQSSNLPSIRPELGEYEKNGTPYVFSPVERTAMEYIRIKTKSFDRNGEPYTYEYSFLKEEKLGDEFVLSYTDKNGNTETYIPPILSYDSETGYSDFYAVEQSTGYDVPLLFWLCSGIGSIRFSARVDLSDDETKKEKELSAYGLASADAPLEIVFNYKKSDNTNEYMVLQVGDTLPTKSGYYFRVGSVVNDIVAGPTIVYRNCVYTTYEQSSLSYAFLHFADFINPLLVAEGLPSDNAFEPYLTTSFKQWKNTSYMHDEEKGIKYVMDKDGKIYLLSDMTDPVSEKAHIVLVKGNKVITDYEYGIITEKDMFEFSVSAIMEAASKSGLFAALKDRETGKNTTPIKVTTSSYSNQVDLDDDIADLYTYKIIGIDAIITDSEDLVNTGTKVEAGGKIKVTYTLEKNGEPVQNSKKENIVFGGVLDLSSSLVPDDVKTALVGKAIGEEINLPFSINYTEANTAKSDFKLYIDEIIDIRSTENPTEKLETVQVGTTVSLRVYDIVDGVKGDTPYTLPIIITENMSGRDANIKAAIMGEKTTRGFNKTVDAFVASLEVMQGYTSYEIDEILGFVSREEIVSFRYTQDSDRDPYYGESLYTNTMEDWRKKLYALEAGSCEKVVQILGGLLENANHSEGLSGQKTVDVVITPEKMIQYGLYANTLYLELPRNIFPISENSKDYTYLSTLNFTIYVSDVNPATQTRYIASNLYDVIAEIDADGFDFLDETFLSLYARKNLVLTGVENLHNVELEFFMDEIHGTYTNLVNEYKVYGYNDKVYGSVAEIQKIFGEDAIKDIAEISVIRIKGDYEAHCSDCQHKVSLLEEKLNSLGNPDGIYFDELYGGKMTPSGADFLGSDSFKEFMGTLFFTIYENELSENNRINITDKTLLLRMKVDLGEDYTQDTGISKYVYEFYKVSDRRVAVRIYQQDASGSIIKDTNGNDITSTDFYISGFAFKKLVSKYWELVNAIPVSKENAFTDYEFFG